MTGEQWQVKHGEVVVNPPVPVEDAEDIAHAEGAVQRMGRLDAIEAAIPFPALSTRKTGALR